MSIRKRLALVLLGCSGLAASAGAQQTFTYSTGACFAAGPCSATTSTKNFSQAPVEQTASIIFTGVTSATSGPTNANGFVSINFGTFTFLPSAGLNQNISVSSLPFTYWIKIISPTVDVQQITFQSSVSDVVVGPGNVGAVTIPQYNGAWYQLLGANTFAAIFEPSGPARSLNGAPLLATSQSYSAALDCSPDVSSDGIFGSPTAGAACPGTPRSTVPEPSSYALMAAGLALTGFVARRRRQS